jgi:hypothetical protein
LGIGLAGLYSIAAAGDLDIGGIFSLVQMMAVAVFDNCCSLRVRSSACEMLCSGAVFIFWVFWNRFWLG